MQYWRDQNKENGKPPNLGKSDLQPVKAVLSAVGEDSEAGSYEDPAPVMTVGATEENEENQAFILTLQLVGYIAAALKAAGWKPKE